MAMAALIVGRKMQLLDVTALQARVRSVIRVWDSSGKASDAESERALPSLPA